MKWVPKVQYGAGPTTFTFSLPQNVWTPNARSIGGSNLAQSGVPETYIIRRDQLCKTTLRYDETEWPSIDAWLAFGQSGQSFFFWFDNTDDGTKYTVFLDMPKPGDGDVTPTREKYTKIFTLPIVIRTTTGTRFDVRIF